MVLPPAHWTGLQPKIFENVSLVGSAAVPQCVDYGWRTGKLMPGQIVMPLAVETSKWKYGGRVFPWIAKPFA